MNLNDYPFETQVLLSDYAEQEMQVLINYLAEVRIYWDQIHAVKECLANDDVEGAKANLADIPEDSQMILWRATTKGSVWTTKERAMIKNG